MFIAVGGYRTIKNTAGPVSMPGHSHVELFTLSNSKWQNKNDYKFKGGYITRSKNLKLHFMVLYDRVGLEKFVGTGLTVKFGLVCLQDTKQKSKTRSPQIAYSGHVTQFDKKVFVQGDA